MTDLKITSKIQQNQFKGRSTVNTTIPSKAYSNFDSVSFGDNNKKPKKKSLFKRIQLAIASLLLAFNTGCTTNTKTQAANQPETSFEQQVQKEDYGNNATNVDKNNENVSIQDELEDHIHAATVITTPHETVRYIYVPKGGTGDGNNDVSVIADNETLADIINENFASINDDNIYPIALDQAKANSEFVLTRINSATRENYDDVADIPADVLLNTKLCVDSKYANNEMSLVDSRYEDFADGTDLSSGRYVDQQMFTSQVSDVTIDPNFEGESGDMVDGKPVYKSVEDAILANYRTEVDAKDVDTSKYGEVSYVKGGGSSEIETIVYKNGTEVYRDRNTGEIEGASVAVEKDSDAYAAIMDGLKDNPANASIVKGKSGQDAIDALNEISGTQSLNLQPTELQRIAVGCDEKTAKQLFADGKDTEFSYLHSTVDKVDMSEKTDDGEYKYQSMMDLMEFYADPSDEAAQNGKSLLDRYNESPNDPETQALIGAAVKNIITKEIKSHISLILI